MEFLIPSSLVLSDEALLPNGAVCERDNQCANTCCFQLKCNDIQECG